MPFSFRLESVLSLKSSQEEMVRNQLAVLNSHVTQARSILEELERTRGDCIAEMDARRRAKRIHPERIRSEALYLDRLNADIHTAKLVLEQRVSAARAKREELVGISRERRILEKLKEKHQARYRREQDRKDATLVTELFLSGMVRAKTE